ncbi:4-alpha-glucanotransferase [Sesbania bispinosa]|nr:4-alpha-glucanotransferase [Sesbania bispinosa]
MVATEWHYRRLHTASRRPRAPPPLVAVVAPRRCGRSRQPRRCYKKFWRRLWFVLPKLK